MAGLEDKLDNVAERILEAAKQGNLSTDAVTFAHDVHANLTNGVAPEKLLTREYVLYLLIAGMDAPLVKDGILDSFMIQRISDLRRSSRTLDSIKTVMTVFGEADFYRRMQGFSKENVQEQFTVGERGKCFVCPEKPNALLLLKDPGTGQLFTMGFDCYKTLLTSLVPEKGTEEHAALEEYISAAGKKIAETEPLAKSLSARERQRLHEFDEFILGLKDDRVRRGALKEAETILEEHGEKYRELDARYWREIGRLMEKAGQYHDVTIATSIAEPKRGWFGMLDTMVKEGASPLIHELVEEQKAALYTPSLGKRIILYNEVLSRTTGGWRNIAGDIVEEIYHAREMNALTPSQLRMYATVGLFQRIEAFMHEEIPDKAIFSEEHRIPYRDLFAIHAVYEGGVRQVRLDKNKEALSEFKKRGYDLVGLVREAESLAKARILSTDLPQRIRDFSQKKWALYSRNHLAYSDHDFVRMVSKRWTQNLSELPDETIEGNAVALEPSYRFREILERLESIAENMFPMAGEVEQRITAVHADLGNPYLLLEPTARNRISRMQGLKMMTSKGLEKLEEAEAAFNRVAGELLQEKRSLHYTLPGVDIREKHVQDALAAYQDNQGKTVAFLSNGLAVVHECNIDKISSKEYIDARAVYAAAQGIVGSIPVSDVIGDGLLDKAKYLAKTDHSVLGFSQADIKEASDLSSLTEEAYIAQSLVSAIHADHEKVLAGEKEILRVIRSEHRELYEDLQEEQRKKYSFSPLRIITSGKSNSESRAYLSKLGFTKTKNDNMMKYGVHAHMLPSLLVSLAEYNKEKAPRERIQVWLFEN
jgi:hypothetical protein